MYLTDFNISLPIGIGLWLVAAVVLANAVYGMMRDDTRGKGRGLSMSRIYMVMAAVTAIVVMRMAGMTHDGTAGLVYMLPVMIICLAVGNRRATVCVSSMLAVQALAFADGGLLALGCNIVNIAVLPCMMGWRMACSMVHTAGRGRAATRSSRAAWQLGIGTVISFTLCSFAGSFERWLSRYAEAAGGERTTFLEGLQATTAVFDGYRSPLLITVTGVVVIAVCVVAMRRINPRHQRGGV